DQPIFTGGSASRPGERHVRDSAGRGGGLDLVVLLAALQSLAQDGRPHAPDSAGGGGGLDLVVLLAALQSVPEADAPAEQDRDHHDVQVVDEPGSNEVADHGGTTDAGDRLGARRRAGGLARL